MAERGRKAKKRATATKRKKPVPQPGSGKTKSIKPKSIKPKSIKPKASSSKASNSRSENARLKSELRAARDRRAASAEVMRLISASPGDADQTLRRIVEIAERLFGASSVSLLIADGERWGRTIRVGAGSERIATAIPLAHVAITPQFMPGAVYLENRQVHVSADDPAALARWPGLTPARAAGTRTMSGTPLRSEGRAIGALIVHRDRPVPFTEDDLALLQSFADQAVIATENARLFNETKEALERQTATAEILKVIASSPSDLQPVFEAIANSANRLIDGFSATVVRFIGNMLHLVAFTPTNAVADEALRASFPRPLAEFASFELVRDGETVQFPDTESEDVPPVNKEMARLRGYRSMVFTPLMSAGMPIGILSVTRVKPGTFAARHVQLLQTFANQAAIAIENAQLFEQVQARTSDLQESLEYQTATSDVLQVISRSTFDLQTVLDTLVESAYKLCGANLGLLYLRGDEAFECKAIAGTGVAEASLLFKGRPICAGRGTAAERVILTGEMASITDFFEDPEMDPKVRETIRNANSSSIGQIRSTLAVPMTRDHVVIGVMVIARSQTGPFPPRQIELLRTFADQAVIAIENARLFDEVQAKTSDLSDSLRQQTVIGDVLKTISRSTFDLQPVLEALVESAARLCDAEMAFIMRREGDVYRAGAAVGFSEEYIEFLKQHPLTVDRGTVTGRAAIERHAVQILDVATDPEYKLVESTSLTRQHTALGVPLLRENEPIGVVVLARQRVQAFTPKQIELVTTFADQAVIAIENVRLFDEVRRRTDDLSEALQQQTATADVLKVISRSAFDLDSVLATLVTSAAKLCEAEKGVIFLREDNSYRLVCNHGFSPEFEAFAKANPLPTDGASTTTRAAASGAVVQIVDVLEDQTLSVLAREYQRLGAYRTNLGVPLRREGETIGVFTLTRQEVRAFTERQIELVETFADQAVIAIENVRLFDEVKAKTADLSESLRQQTATADVLKVISRSAFDLQAVFDTLISSAVELSGAFDGTICLRDGDEYRYLATAGMQDDLRKFLLEHPPTPGRASAMGRVLLSGKVESIPDVLEDADYLVPVSELNRTRSVLGVPLLRNGKVEGGLMLARVEPGRFTQRQIELVQTFADQAVIAIENVRLFDEVQARTKELAASLEELRTAQDRLVQTEKLASLGQLTAGIAHEIKNPLNFVNNFSSLSAELIDELNHALKPAALDDKVREEIDELTELLRGNLEKVVQHGKRADSIVKNMLLHSREGAGEHRPADINAIVEESLNLAYHGARAERAGFNITLQRDLDPAAGMIDLYPQEITRVFLNLISNGFYAAAKRKEAGDEGFEPTLCATTKDLGNEVEIRIRDNGNGIPLDVKEKMFNPFFTTKPAGEGTGLGLSMSHDIVVKQHGGKIDVDTMPGAFTEFIITLPRMAAQLQAGGTN
jgi:two-component system NtrC family sensor kinase